MGSLDEHRHRLTTEQSLVADDDGRHLCVTGAAGTGKTSALVARYLRLVKRHSASSVLVICRNREAADRFRYAVISQLGGGFDSLPITTPHGLAFDLVRRHHGEVELLTSVEQHELVRTVLAEGGRQAWPTLGRLVGREAFAREVGAAVIDLEASLLEPEEILARAAEAGASERWKELLAFAGRCAAALQGSGTLDHASLLATAAGLLDTQPVRKAEQGRFRHVLLDDYEAAAPATGRLVVALAGLGARVVFAGNAAAAVPSTGAALASAIDATDIILKVPFRHPTPPTLLRCGHPGVEPEAIAGLLLAEHADGVPWSDMAVLVRSIGPRGRDIARALARHGVPVSQMAALAGDDPAVLAVHDTLRWAGGDRAALDRLLASPVTGVEPAELRAIRQEAAARGIVVEDHPRLAGLAQLTDVLRRRADRDSPADLAFEVWRRAFGNLVVSPPSSGDAGATPDDRALDAMVAFHDGLRRRAERHPQERLADFVNAPTADVLTPDPWRGAAPMSGDTVTITSIAGAAGREWHTVVVAGCVEGELPRVHAHVRLFDRAIFGAHARRPDAAERLRHALEDERRLFAVATSRATGRLVASAAPEPGVLLSRFVENWPELAPELPLAPGPPAISRAATVGLTPVHPDPSLRLSASQLNTYDDCPLRYSYEYVLGARDDPGVRADLGSLVHEVLATFLDPAAAAGQSTVARTKEALLTLGEQLWRDDIARYRPQVEEARRDFFAMLHAWWDGEGCQISARANGSDDDVPLAPEVLAVERRFDVGVGPHRVRGAIDRVDRADDGAGIRIVDYKTGKAEPRPGAIDDDLQLAIYHLAATRDPDLAAFGPPTQLRLLYLRTMHRYEQAVGAGHEALTEERVLERADRIRAERFEPSVDANCRTCACQRICPLHDEGRQISERPGRPVHQAVSGPPSSGGGPLSGPGTEVPLVMTVEQAAAVEAPLTPLLLVAGAGAGKTTVMAQRILHLVEKGLARPDQVLGLTFTNKAASHLKEKVRRALGADTDVTVATYHSFAASLVADHSLELDLDPGTQVLNRAQSWQLLYAVFDEFRFERRSTFSPQLLLDDALNLAARCGDHLVPVEAVIDDCADVMHTGRWKPMRDAAEKRRELCQVVAAYERRKRERNLIDFGDQVRLAVQLLAEHPEVAEAVRRQRPVVLLDEYQDTNYAQRRMIELLHPTGDGASPAITAVGDDMQSIYGFRGAHLANIQQFGLHFPPVEIMPLQTTFRFGPALVELANRIQGEVPGSLPKTLRADPEAAETSIECLLAADDTEEAAAIADDIVDHGAPGECAVLCRKRRLIRPIVDALEERGVPVEVVGASGLLDRPEVVDLVAWLDVLADLDSTVPLLRILQGPRYRIGLRDLAALARQARAGADAGPWRLADALRSLDNVQGLGDDARARLREFCAERHQLAATALRQPILDLSETVIMCTGLWRATDARGRENLLRFLDLAQRFAPVEGDPGLPAFVEYLQLLDESDEDLAEAHLSDADAVKVMTIHQAKGLEFPVVYVPGLAGSRGSSRIFPDNRAGENALSNSAALPWWLRESDGIPHPAGAARQADIDDVIRRRRLDEEWRLLYVACTRARRRLVCTAAHWYRGAAEPQGPSRFYDFIAAQTHIVTERYRHDAATVDPDAAAKEKRRLLATANYAAPVPAAQEAPQLELSPSVMPVLARPERQGPRTVSVTGLVTYARCPRQFYWTVVRPLPRRSSAAARVGTEVHRWIEQRSGRQLSLIEPDADDHPDTVGDASEPSLSARLKASFLDSPWAHLDPVRAEAPFVLVLGRHVVRGRIDAVYEHDGRLELVDFKTGRPPSPGDVPSRVQLELYGLAAVDTSRADPSTLRTTYCWLRGDGPPVVDSTDWSPAVLQEVRERLAATLDELAAERYQAVPGSWCGSCDFVSFCEAGQQHVAKVTSSTGPA